MASQFSVVEHRSLAVPRRNFWIVSASAYQIFRLHKKCFYLLQLCLCGITSCKCTPSEAHLLFQSLVPAANTASLENWNRTLYLGQCEAILWRFWERFIHLCKNNENVDTEVEICRRVSYKTMYAVCEAYANFYTFWLTIFTFNF